MMTPLEEMILDSVVESFALEASLEVRPAALLATSAYDAPSVYWLYYLLGSYH